MKYQVEMLYIFCIYLTLLTYNDIITESINNFRSVKSYSATLRSGKGNSAEIIRYYYKKPGFIRMNLVKPHNGAVLVYHPLKKEVRLRLFDFSGSPVFTFSPGSRFIKSSKGHRIDESDIGSLLKVVKRLQRGGKTLISPEGRLGERPAIKVNIAGIKGYTVNGIHRYILWLDKASFLPLKVSSFNIQGDLIEEVLMDDLRINISISEDFFSL